MLRDEKKNKTDFGVYHARKISAQKYRVEINKSGGEFVNVKIITKGPFGCFPFSFFLTRLFKYATITTITFTRQKIDSKIKCLYSYSIFYLYGLK